MSVTGRRATVFADDGARLAAWVHEPTSRRPETVTVVLAHGWTLTHESWARVVPLMQKRTAARVVIYDQRGHGASDAHGPRVRGRRGATSITKLGDDLAAVISALAPEGPLVLGGHSMGGMTVMAYAGRHPDDVAARVRGVAFVSTSAGEMTGLGRRGETAFMRLASLVPVLRAGRTITLEGQRRLQFGAQPDPADVALTRHMVASTRLSTLGRYYGALGRHDEEGALATLGSIPVHVVVGELDRLTPVRHTRRLAELVPNAALDVLPGRGHMLGFEAPDVVAEHLVDLVEGTARRPAERAVSA